jgi:hypothetical protein
MEQGSSTSDKPHAAIVLLNKNKNKFGIERRSVTRRSRPSKRSRKRRRLLLFSVNAVTQGTEPGR